MKRRRLDRYDGPTTLVVDVSAHNGVIDWPRVARSEATLDGRTQGPVRAAVVRAADGIQTRRDSAADPMAVRNLVGAYEAGIDLLAVYLYVRGWHPGAEQAEVALEAVRVAGVPCPWVALDVEDGAWASHDGSRTASTGEVLSALRSAASHIEACGMRVVVYTGATWNGRVSGKGLTPPWCRWPLWVPDYLKGRSPRLPVDQHGRPSPWPSAMLWQFTGDGRVAGINGPVDLSRFRGDQEEMRAWWAGA